MSTIQSQQRFTRLQQVFLKASDSSFHTLSENDLKDCFGELSGKYGAVLSKVFLNNLVAKTQRNIESSFNDVCLRYDIEEKLSNLENYSPPVQSNDASLEVLSLLKEPSPTISKVLINMKEVERQELLLVISQLETDMKRLNEIASRLRAQVNNELSAATEEKQRIESLASIIDNSLDNK